MNYRAIYKLLRETLEQWTEEDITRLGAALAYYAAFALIPLLLLIASLAATLMGSNQAESQIRRLIIQFIGQEAARTLQDAVANVSNGGIPATLTTVVSIGTLLFAATGLFRQLKSALNVIWNVPPATSSKVQGFLRDTALSLLMVMALGIVLLLVMVINTILFNFLRTLSSQPSDIQWLPLWQIIGFVLLFLFTTLIFATLYKVLPDADVVWGDVWVGAGMTALLFTIGQAIIATLLSQNTMDNLYGAASTLIFVLIWVHLSAHIVLLGAEFTQVYANRCGSKIIPAKMSQRDNTTQENHQG